MKTSNIIVVMIVIVLMAITYLIEKFREFHNNPVGKRCRIKGTHSKGTCTEHVGREFYCIVLDEGSHIVLPKNDLKLIIWEW